MKIIDMNCSAVIGTHYCCITDSDGHMQSTQQPSEGHIRSTRSFERLFLKSTFAFLFIFSFLLPTYRMLANDYYVNAITGDNTGGTGSIASPWKTITYALGQITGTGHTVYVASGTYNIALGETFPILIKNGVSLVGDGIDKSIIDAGGTNTAIRCVSIVDATTGINMLTINGGSSSSGGGFYISAGSVLKIVNNKITANNGDGIYMVNSSPVIINNIVGGNSGNGIYISNSSPLIKGNSITGNTSSYGLYITGSTSSPRIVNNVIANNSDAGIYCTSSSRPKIINNTISDNMNNGIYISSASPDSIFNNIISLNSSYGIYESGSTSDPGKVWYNLFYANTSGLYYDEGTTEYITVSLLNSSVMECKNNITGDPLFVDKINGNYHERVGSPAIDAGDPTFDYGNEPPPNGSRINIGAYGNTTEATITSAPPSLPASLYVNASTGSNTTGDGSQSNPWKTITYALNQITGTGHTIYVSSGTYNTVLGEGFPIMMKNGISLVGAGIDLSTISATGTNNKVIECVSIDVTTRIEGFTITGGKLVYPNTTPGGGMFISAGSLLTIVNNKITGNNIEHHPWNMGNQKGAGIYIENSSPIILNNVISGNTGDFSEGFGIYVNNSSPLIEGNRIISNSGWTGAYGDGSGLAIGGALSFPRIFNNVVASNGEHGIRCDQSSSPKIYNNQIYTNTDDGIYIASSNPCIINNTISDNAGNGITISSAKPDSIINNIISLNSAYGINESESASSPVRVWYNLFYSNGSGMYRDGGTTDYYTVATLEAGASVCKNNVEGDPMFVDRVNGDYHLRLGSPAIDAGDYNSPVDPDGTRADIGAFSFTQSVSVPSSPSLSSPINNATSQPTTITLTWIASSGAAKYHLQISVTSTFTTLVMEDSSLTQASRSVGSLVNSTLYYWRVRAGNSAGWSAFSGSWSFTTKNANTAPAIPQNLTATASNGQVTLKWNKNTESDFLRYRIYRGTSSSPTIVSDSTTAGISDTVRVISGLTNGTTYYLRITAIDSARLESGYSNEVSATPKLEENILRLSPFAISGQYLNAQIAADTVANGWVSGREYILQRGGIYLWNAIVDVPAGRTIKIHSDYNSSAQRDPIIYLYPTGTGGSPNRPPGYLLQASGGTINLKHLLISGYYEPSVAGLDSIQGVLLDVLSGTTGSNIYVDSCILKTTSGNHIRTDGKPVTVRVTIRCFQIWEMLHSDSPILERGKQSTCAIMMSIPAISRIAHSLMHRIVSSGIIKQPVQSIISSSTTILSSIPCRIMASSRWEWWMRRGAVFYRLKIIC
jgi:parallel beta-helix repeat protein